MCIHREAFGRVLTEFEKWAEGVSAWNNAGLWMSLYMQFRKCQEPVCIVCE